MGLLFKGPWVRLLLSHSDQLPLTSWVQTQIPRHGLFYNHFMHTTFVLSTMRASYLHVYLSTCIWPIQHNSHSPCFLKLTLATSLKIFLITGESKNYVKENLLQDRCEKLFIPFTVPGTATFQNPCYKPSNIFYSWH